MLREASPWRSRTTLARYTLDTLLQEDIDTTLFEDRGDEAFKLTGDDDVFVFFDKKLVITIGGIHSALTKGVKRPDVANSIGVVVGQEYPLDFFQAERHVVRSKLRIDTTLELVPDVVR